METLHIQNFGPIRNVEINFGDLTFLIGPQASGKSLALEVLKLIKDRESILSTLENHSFAIDNDAKRILNAYFGEGMEKLWKPTSKLSLDGLSLTKTELKRTPQPQESSVFFVPAQRVICMDDGYPRNFNSFENDAPYVLREFSETLRTYMQSRSSDKSNIFPPVEKGKSIQASSFDASIFHNGEIHVSDTSSKKKFMLEVDGLEVPFMAWSAGQKEFMPLLLSFYCLTASPSKLRRREKYKIAVVEEPEMGLHPKAIESILLQLLQLIKEGYQVIVSTHSTLFLDFAWAFNTIKSRKGNNLDDALAKLFESTNNGHVNKLVKDIASKNVKTIYFDRNSKGKIWAKDISSLDVMSDSVDLAEWGGIMDFSTRANDVVSRFS